MKQQTLALAADARVGFEQYRRATKREVFLATMNERVPWQVLCKVIEPHYPQPGHGRPPVGLERVVDRTRRLLMQVQLPDAQSVSAANVLHGFTDKRLSIAQPLRRCMTDDQGRALAMHKQPSQNMGMALTFATRTAPGSVSPMKT